MAQDHTANKNSKDSKHIGDIAWDNGSEPPRRKHPAPKLQTQPSEHRRHKNAAQGSEIPENPHRNGGGRRRGSAADTGSEPQNRHNGTSEKRRNKVSEQTGTKRRGTRNPRELVVETLMRIDGGGFSNIVWDLAIKHADLNNLDKMLATRIFYGTLSNMRLIDALWNDIEPEMLRRADPVVKMTLRSAMYQLVFLDRVPAYSIVSTSVDVVKRLRNRAASGYCNALLRKAVTRKEQNRLHYTETGDALTDFAVRYSLNNDLARLLMDEFGAEAEKIAESMLAVPKMVLRVNRSHTTMREFLARPGISAEPSVRLPESACAVLARHEEIDAALDAGDVCVQDEAAQIAVSALGTPDTWAPGRSDVHIWDACAGMGGKSIHLLDQIACDKSGRKFAVLSTDIYANKLERLKDYQQKYFSKQTLLTKTRDLTVGGSVQLAPFDAILVDAPCSGLGVLRRHPEVKITRTSEAIASLVILQREILDNVCRHLRPGGILIYAVCTITREECEKQAAAFLERHPNYAADPLPAICGALQNEAQRRLMPHTDGCDGFFVARFKRIS